MSIELIIFLTMVATFIGGCFLLKLPVSISMVASAVAGALVAGEGLPLRHLVEGMFSYVDTILVITCAMIFMRVVQDSGALDALASLIIEKFHKTPALLLCLIMLVIMFPGMITGSSTASVLSAGSIMAPVLMLMGIPMLETACILAMGGVLGMIAPPVNIPAMIIGGGIDIPYVGFELPLALLTFPLAIFSVLFFGYKYVKALDYQAIKSKLNNGSRKEFGFKVYIPLFVAIILMVVNKTIPAVPDLGMPLVFLIAAGVGMFTGYKINIVNVCKESIKSVLPVLGILMGVGMFIQIMTLTGVRGFIVTSCLSLPNLLLYIAMAISIPLFGSVSSYGAASVLGVPFLLAFMSKNQIVTAAAISLIASLGDMMPPTALAGIFAAQVVGLEKYTPVLKKCVVPALLIIAWAIFFIVFANKLAPFIVLK
ncbi:TRAP transporter large permease subunit [Oscillospiraceae bacterium LTW-04]|nr:TRAP transporter large permease subunit [Oscillospiraceae bacterium MB24-C1]